MVTKSSKTENTKSFKYVLFAVVTLIGASVFSQSTYNLGHFEKVVINPHIQFTFVEGDEESVTIDTNEVSNEKLNIQVKDNTLHIYLDDARVVTKSETYEGRNRKVYC